MGSEILRSAQKDKWGKHSSIIAHQFLWRVKRVLSFLVSLGKYIFGGRKEVDSRFPRLTIGTSAGMTKGLEPRERRMRATGPSAEGSSLQHDERVRWESGHFPLAVNSHTMNYRVCPTREEGGSIIGGQFEGDCHGLPYTLTLDPLPPDGGRGNKKEELVGSPRKDTRL